MDDQEFGRGNNLSVNVTVNSDCPEEEFVTVTFGTIPMTTDGCNGQINVTKNLFPGNTTTFSVATDSISQGDGEVYCYIVHIDRMIGKSTLPHFNYILFWLYYSNKHFLSFSHNIFRPYFNLLIAYSYLFLIHNYILYIDLLLPRVTRLVMVNSS